LLELLLIVLYSINFKPCALLSLADSVAGVFKLLVQVVQLVLESLDGFEDLLSLLRPLVRMAGNDFALAESLLKHFLDSGCCSLGADIWVDTSDDHSMLRDEPLDKLLRVSELSVAHLIAETEDKRICDQRVNPDKYADFVH
jgi:hypothetical protein